MVTSTHELATPPRTAPGRSLLRLCGPLLFGLAMWLGATPAHADLKLCNTTASRVGVSIGYKDMEGWASEGWWNIASHTCETLLKGVLIGRFYYIHAVDYDRGGEWAGRLFMCTDDKSFTIRDTADCEKRGHKRTGFFEVDTGEERDWTVRLTDPDGEAKSQ
ncbi:DUF1036 domain-containing protein [Methyloceanibacter superfactus]|jgi:uncharacterized membrane protein